MTAIEAALGGLIDYAGLYPPAALDMRTAVRNYLGYRQGTHRAALGRFVVSLDRISDLRSAAGESFAEMRLSVVLPADADFKALHEILGGQFERSVFECKVSEPAEIERLGAQFPESAERYFEIPIQPIREELLDAIAACGARAKLRMGGLMADAFPSPKATALMLRALAGRHLAFKATAGLHHPVRSHHPFTYESHSASGMMHGFLNLAFASALLHYGGSAGEVLHTLEEEDPSAWRVSPEAICCRAFLWTVDQLREMRQFFISFGSCSFEEPMRDLEALGWL